jgi:RNA polymerase sigma-70 factor (ECF subfamily)
LNHYSEIEIINGCKNENRIFQKLLYDKYKDAMYTICKRLLNDEDLACDALQEGFVEVFRGIHSFQGSSTIGAWIKTILIRKSILIGKRFRMYDEIDLKQHDTTIHWDSNLTGEELNMAINKLPDGYRKIFLLIEVEGYTHKEVAELLGIAEGTSKSQLFHSKKMLQKTLSEFKN